MRSTILSMWIFILFLIGSRNDGSDLKYPIQLLILTEAFLDFVQINGVLQPPDPARNPSLQEFYELNYGLSHFLKPL